MLRTLATVAAAFMVVHSVNTNAAEASDAQSGGTGAIQPDHLAGGKPLPRDIGMFAFSGYGTLGAVHSSEQDADFISTVFKPNRAGHSRCNRVSLLALAAIPGRPSAEVIAIVGPGNAVVTPQ